MRWLRSPAVALGCLLLLATGIHADESTPLEPQDNYRSQGFSPELPEVLKARARLRNLHTNNSRFSSRFEEPVGKIDYFQLGQLEIQADQNRERSRKRLVLPAEAYASLEGTNLADAVDHSERAVIAREAQARLDNTLYQGSLTLLIILGLGILAQRKFVPELNERIYGLINPWSLDTSVEIKRAAVVLEEEKSFLEFQAQFRVGAPAAGASGPAGLAADLFDSARRRIGALQKLVQEARLATGETEQRKLLREVRGKLQSLKDLVAHPELLPLQQMTSALEPLVKRLIEKPANLTSSTLRTITQGIEVLTDLCHAETQRDLLTKTPLRFLVVDDEMLSRHALCVALKRTLCEPEVADNPGTALEMASRQIYDIIFLDVSMPGMDGFELCTRIHEGGLNRVTPVVFVTSLRDFDTRAKSIVCGGRDLISKPFLTFELTVKALTLAARERMHGRGSLAAAASIRNEELAAKPAATEPAPMEMSKPAPAPLAKAAKSADKPTMSDLKLVGAQTKLARAFLLQAQVQADGLRELMENIQSAENQAAQKEMISNLHLRVHSLTVGAEASEQRSLSQITSALEGLVNKFVKNPKNATAATLQTAAKAVNLIQELCVADPGLDPFISAPIRVLAVDDDPLARRFMLNALQLKFLLPQGAPDGKTALALAAEQPFDVIFLDVQMPDLDGFAVCRQLRESAINRTTPVAFVTSSTDAAVKAQAADCGSADFITKPYSHSELALKTITFAFRNRLSNPAGLKLNPLPRPDAKDASIAAVKKDAATNLESCNSMPAVAGGAS